jgi:hypothetical protein
MKTPYAAAAVAVLAFLATTDSGAAPAATAAQRVGWLAGCWSGEKGTTRFREMWTVASPDLVLGINVTTSPSKPAEFEYLRIETREGRLALVPQPGGAPPTRFELSPADSTADTAMFVNLQHDFPKRIAYRRLEAGASLLAWIDGGAEGSMRMDYPMKRVPCSGETP